MLFVTVLIIGLAVAAATAVAHGLREDGEAALPLRRGL